MNNNQHTLAGEDPKQDVDDKKTYYDFQELLGEGAFCKVFRAIYKPTGEVVAVKVQQSKSLMSFRLLRGSRCLVLISKG
jgi:serine/threonine protein kinase